MTEACVNGQAPRLMTDETNTDKAIAGTLTSLKRRIVAKRWLATLSILAERLSIALLPALAVLSLYMILSWFGLFRLIPDWLRIAIVASSIILLVMSLVSLRKLSLPRRAQAQIRLETKSGITHQAIRMLEDQPVRSDPFGAALWRAHIERMTARIGMIEAGFPSPDIARHDPYALRAAIVCLLLVSWGFSFSGAGGSLKDGFDAPRPKLEVAAGARVDAWITPPAYTGQAPVYLTGVKPASPDPILVPQNSELSVRVSGLNGAAVPAFHPDGGGKPIALEDNSKPGKPKSGEAKPGIAVAMADEQAVHGYHLKLARDGTIDLAGKTYHIQLKPDLLPKIAFTKEPVATINGALEISFSASDDYGIIQANADIVPLDGDRAALALFDLPEYRLDIPANGKGQTKATSSRDLTEHPLSGKKVRVTLVATDALGQTAKSEPRDIILPARPFSQPLAASVAEQRQVFSLDMRKIRRALELNEASTLRPEQTVPNLAHYLLVQSVANRLKMSRNAEMLRATADYFWEVARGIEDGDLSLAEKKLKIAQQALADALKRNAPDEEIAKLMAELRKAMNEYIAELAKRSQSAGKQLPLQTARNVIRSQDLQKMLDQLENLARSGSREEAQKLLNDMQRLMNNLNTARPRNDQNDQNNPARQQIDRLGKIIQEQEKLMDETHRLEQALRDRQQRNEFSDPEDGSPPVTEEPSDEEESTMSEDGPQAERDRQPDDSPTDEMTAEQLKEALKQLKSRQEQLEQGLGDLQKKLGEMGMKPSPGFGEGKKEMKNAAGALGKAQGQRAVDSQGRALEALRKGAGDMMRQMMQAQGRGQGNRPDQTGQSGQQGGDPLGRQSGQTQDDDNLVKVPDEIDIQRAREILDAIRKRLTDGTNSTIERNYLERLLDLAR